MNNLTELVFLDVLESNGLYFATLIKNNNMSDFFFVEIDDPEATLAKIENLRLDDSLFLDDEEEEDLEFIKELDIYHNYIYTMMTLNYDIVELLILSKDSSTYIYDTKMRMKNFITNEEKEIKMRISDLINFSIRTGIPILAPSEIFDTEQKNTKKSSKSSSNKNKLNKGVDSLENKLLSLEKLLEQHIENEEYEKAHLVNIDIKKIRQDLL